MAIDSNSGLLACRELDDALAGGAPFLGRCVKEAIPRLWSLRLLLLVPWLRPGANAVLVTLVRMLMRMLV